LLVQLAGAACWCSLLVQLAGAACWCSLLETGVCIAADWKKLFYILLLFESGAKVRQMLISAILPKKQKKQKSFGFGKTLRNASS